MRPEKKDWPAGPWQTEPDELRWRDEPTGLDCHARRGHGGAWCGYVAIPKEHPLHGVEYNQEVPDRLTGAAESVMEGEVGKRGPMSLFVIAGRGKPYAGDLFNVHGSITYSGDRDGVFWYGFDCAHCDDLSPAYEHDFRSGTYRDLEYVKAECAALARQLQAMVVPEPV